MVRKRKGKILNLKREKNGSIDIHTCCGKSWINRYIGNFFHTRCYCYAPLANSWIVWYETACCKVALGIDETKKEERREHLQRCPTIRAIFKYYKDMMVEKRRWSEEDEKQTLNKHYTYPFYRATLFIISFFFPIHRWRRWCDEIYVRKCV